MASSDNWDPQGVFTIVDGPGDGEFATYFPTHLRNPQDAHRFQFSYHCPENTASGCGEFVITAVGYRRLGRYHFHASREGKASGVMLGLSAMIEGWYDPVRRKGYFRVVPLPGEVGSLIREDTAADQRWATYVTAPFEK